MASNHFQRPANGTFEMINQQSKTDADVGISPFDAESNEPDGEFRSTSRDAANMRRMGKNQQLVRRFRVLSMASFVAVATAAWEFTV